MTAINSVTDLSIDGEVALVTINSPPVNALSQPVRDGLKRGVEAAEANSAVKAIAIICDGRTFIAGADISEFGKPFAPPPLPEALDAMENASKPVIAALHGTALGGGFEVALTAHYRIAVPSAKCGLPEIKLGIIPGAGGTQRLPRLIGPEKALDVILSGVPFGAREAKEWGVVDELAEEGKLRESAIAFARRLIAEKAPLKKVRDRSDKLEPARGHPEIFEAICKANARKFRGFEAWEKAIESVKNALDLPFDEGMAKERALFAALVVTTQSKAQRHVFFAERQAAKVADIPADTPTRKIAKVGVIGAGTMGGGIAMNFLSAGIPVTIVETSKEALDRGVSIMRRNYENTAKKGRMTMAEVEERMGRLSPTLDFNTLADADFTITIADASSPAILLRTVDRDPKRLASRHQQEIDRITRLAIPKTASRLNLDAPDAYAWSLYHLLQDEDVIGNDMFEVTYYSATGGNWVARGSERPRYFDIGDVGHCGDLDSNTLCLIADHRPSEAPIGTHRLLDMAVVIRSKDAGVNRLTFDVIFTSGENYEAALHSSVFSKDNIAEILGLPPERVIGTFFVDSCNAIKISIDRPNISASVDERDVFGSQQQAAIEHMNIPIYRMALAKASSF